MSLPTLVVLLLILTITIRRATAALAPNTTDTDRNAS